MSQNSIEQLDTRIQDSPIIYLEKLRRAEKAKIVSDTPILMSSEGGILLANQLTGNLNTPDEVGLLKQAFLCLDYVLLGLKTSILRGNIQNCIDPSKPTFKIADLSQAGRYIEEFQTTLNELEGKTHKSLLVSRRVVPIVSILIDLLTTGPTPPGFETTIGVLYAKFASTNNLKILKTIKLLSESLSAGKCLFDEDRSLQDVERSAIIGRYDEAYRQLDDADGIIGNNQFTPEYLQLAELLLLDTDKKAWGRLKEVRTYVAGLLSEPKNNTLSLEMLPA